MVTHVDSLTSKIKNRDARIAVIGLGYTGLPLAVAFASTGFAVTGIDIDTSRVDQINASKSYIGDIPDSDLRAAIKNGGSLEARTDYDGIADVDAVIVAVPTPLSKTGHPDLSYVVSAIDSIASRINPGTLVVLQSTTYPGTTDEVVVPALNNGPNGDMTPGLDVFVAYAPERIDPGRLDWTLETTPKVVGGMTPTCARMAAKLYGTVVQTVVEVGSPTEAEMVKLLETTFRATNIALVNEIAIMCDKLDINVWNVIDAAATKPFGFMRFTPGPGLGGHCIPVDPQYLAWKLRSLNYHARFIQLAEDINSSMPGYVVSKVQQGLNQRGKPMQGSRVLCLGVTYKPNVSDIRESPSINVIDQLQDLGAEVMYNDPNVPEFRVEDIALSNVELTVELLESVDCVVALTDHDEFDWAWICAHAQLFMDAQNVSAGIDIDPGKLIGL